MVNINETIVLRTSENLYEHYIRQHIEKMGHQEQAQVANLILDVLPNTVEEMVKRISTSEDYTETFIREFPLPFDLWLKIAEDIERAQTSRGIPFPKSENA